MKTAFRFPRHIGRVVIGVAAVVAVIVGILVAVNRWEQGQFTEAPWETAPTDTAGAPSSTDGRQRFYIDGKTYLLRQDLETVLLIGVDKYQQNSIGSYNNNQRADFLMLVVIDRQEKTYSVLHLNRDTMAPIRMLGVKGEVTGTYTAQLALAHAYGSGGKDSCQNTAQAVSALLYGVDVQHYACITMDALAILNDQVGGVTLTLMDDLSEIDPAMEKGKELTLRGDQARIYVQSRYGLEDSTNLHRMERQRQYMSEWMKAARQKAETQSTFVAESALAISDYFVSDLTVNELSKFADSLLTFEGGAIDDLKGEASVVDGYMQFVADEDALRQTVLQLFYEEETAE